MAKGKSPKAAVAIDTTPCRLYLVTPPRLDPKPFADLLARALDAGDVGAVQLRLKDLDDDALKRAIEVLRPVVQSRDVAFLLNDRADLVLPMGCDGVHLGQEDGDHAAARLLLGPDLTLGITCHDSRHLAMRAGEMGADYVAFGAFFPTATKQVEHLAEVEVLAWWSEVFEVPSVAIGGINAGNCAPLVRAGADFLAVVGAVWNHPEGPAAGVQAMNMAMAHAAVALDDDAGSD